MMRLICCLLIFCCYLNAAEAYINKPITKLTEPKATIIVPRGFIKRNKEKIYTPDRYHCYMKKTLKYCTDNHGRAINGYIVNSYGGDLAYEAYQNGYQSGITSVYGTDGTLLRRSEYKKGLKNGEEIVYYFNGNVEFIKHYKDGALNGRIEQYDINGVLIGKFNYKDGWLRDGYCKNEAKDHSMEERLKEKEYNQLLPCGNAIDIE